MLVICDEEIQINLCCAPLFCDPSLSICLRSKQVSLLVLSILQWLNKIDLLAVKACNQSKLVSSAFKKQSPVIIHPSQFACDQNKSHCTGLHRIAVVESDRSDICRPCLLFVVKAYNGPKAFLLNPSKRVSPKMKNFVMHDLHSLSLHLRSSRYPVSILLNLLQIKTSVSQIAMVASDWSNVCS